MSNPTRKSEFDVLECRAQQDCGAGHSCNIGLGGTWCSGRAGDAPYTMTCERDEQCAAFDRVFPLAKARRCVSYGIDDLKGCLGQ